MNKWRKKDWVKIIFYFLIFIGALLFVVKIGLSEIALFFLILTSFLFVIEGIIKKRFDFYSLFFIWLIILLLNILWMSTEF